jgi:hypothetical protein
LADIGEGAGELGAGDIDFNFQASRVLVEGLAKEFESGFRVAEIVLYFGGEGEDAGVKGVLDEE